MDYYLSQGITLTSEPLSVYQFRHVLPFDQIESFSLFNVETFETFKAGIEGRRPLKYRIKQVKVVTSLIKPAIERVLMPEVRYIKRAGSY